VCYLSLDGVVLGADSTGTMSDGGRLQFLDHHQKVLEIGEKSTLGIVIWGLAGFGEKSYRTMVAEFADDLEAAPAASMSEVAQRWAQRFWAEYTGSLQAQIDRYAELVQKDPRSAEENEELATLDGLSGGFCIGGRIRTDRTPHAFSVSYHPRMSGGPEIEELQYDVPLFWGVPNLLNRLFFGIDDSLFGRVIDSGKWNGTPNELFELVRDGMIRHPGRLPIREAIDWVYSSIFITIKAIKFSSIPPICGGPIEIAAITTDRPFRWVRHKRLDEGLRQATVQGSVP